MAGLLAFKTVGEIQAEENPEANAVQETPTMTQLASHIREAWTRNRDAKTDIERDLLRAMKQRKGEYDADILAKIRKFGGSEDFIRITDIKCKALEGWLKDIMLPPGERPWSVDPTPISDLKPEDENKIVQDLLIRYQQAIGQGVPQEQVLQMIEGISGQLEEEAKNKIQEQARKEAKGIEFDIDDVLIESGWYKTLSALIRDIGTFKAVFMEGPIVEIEPQLEWMDEGNGVSIPAVSAKPKRKYYRISPFDVYPSPGALTCDDGDLLIKRRFSRKALKRFKGVEGFDSESIDLVLQRYGAGYIDWTAIDSERAEITEHKNRQQNSIGTIDALKYFGSVRGVDLLQWGMSPEVIPDPLDEYEIIAYLVNDIVISAKLNPHPLGKRGLFSTSYCPNNESIWGDSLCDVMRDIQKICNASVRALVTNMGIAAGPQGWYNSDAFNPEGDLPTDQWPLKMWPFTTQDLQHGVPMGWFQPSSNADVLIKVYDYFYNMASEITGIPTYMSGSPKVGGAGQTASGLSMLMDAAGKSMKNVVSSLDCDIVVPTIEETWLHIMMYEPEKAKGDIRIVARASDYLVQKETLQVRRQEFLAFTNNPTDIQIMGMTGRAEVLREVAGSLKLPKNKIVPDREGFEAQEDQAKLMQVLNILSSNLGIPVEVLMGALQGGQPVEQNNNQQAVSRGTYQKGTPVFPGGQAQGAMEMRVT